MQDTIAFAHLLLAVSLAATVGILSNRLSARARVPAPLLFLAGAAVAVAVVPQLTAPAEQTVERLLTVCLLCILFDGGIHIGRDRFQAAATPMSGLASAGTPLCCWEQCWRRRTPRWCSQCSGTGRLPVGRARSSRVSLAPTTQ
jgi:cell volume regulation protein A